MRKHSFPLALIKINYGNHLAAMAIAVVRIVIRDEIGIHWRIFGAPKPSHSLTQANAVTDLFPRTQAPERPVEPGVRSQGTIMLNTGDQRELSKNLFQILVTPPTKFG